MGNSLNEQIGLPHKGRTIITVNINFKIALHKMLTILILSSWVFTIAKYGNIYFMKKLKFKIQKNYHLFIFWNYSKCLFDLVDDGIYNMQTIIGVKHVTA